VQRNVFSAGAFEAVEVDLIFSRPY